MMQSPMGTAELTVPASPVPQKAPEAAEDGASGRRPCCLPVGIGWVGRQAQAAAMKEW